MIILVIVFSFRDNEVKFEDEWTKIGIFYQSMISFPL